MYTPAFVILVISAFSLDYMALGEDPSASAVLPSPTLPGYSSYGAPPSPPSFSGYSSYGAPPSPPSFSGYPSYGAPPPPRSLSIYPAYGAPPPPPARPGQANCPPVPVQCCQYPTNPNPNEYYHPIDDHSPTPYSPLTTFSIVILLLSFAVVF